MPVTLPELAQAARNAQGTLITTEIERRAPLRPDRYIIRNVHTGRIIKRFRPRETALHLNQWIDQRFPRGVFITSAIFKDRHCLRYARSLWTHEVWQRALRLNPEETPTDVQ